MRQTVEMVLQHPDVPTRTKHRLADDLRTLDALADVAGLGASRVQGVAMLVDDLRLHGIHEKAAALRDAIRSFFHEQPGAQDVVDRLRDKA